MKMKWGNLKYYSSTKIHKKQNLNKLRSNPTMKQSSTEKLREDRIGNKNAKKQMSKTLDRADVDKEAVVRHLFTASPAHNTVLYAHRI